MWLFRGEGFGKGKNGEGRGGTHFSKLLTSSLALPGLCPKTLEILFALWQKSPGPAPSQCEFLEGSTWHVETTGWKSTTVSGEYQIIYRLDVGSF